MVESETVVALTDERWFEFLSSLSTDGRLGEVNFWRPLPQIEFRSNYPCEWFFGFQKGRAARCATCWGTFQWT